MLAPRRHVNFSIAINIFFLLITSLVGSSMGHSAGYLYLSTSNSNEVTYNNSDMSIAVATGAIVTFATVLMFIITTHRHWRKNSATRSSAYRYAMFYGSLNGLATHIILGSMAQDKSLGFIIEHTIAAGILSGLLAGLFFGVIYYWLMHSFYITAPQPSSTEPTP